MHVIFQEEIVQQCPWVWRPENFGMKRTEQHKLVPLGNSTVKLEVFCFILLLSRWSKPYLFESRENKTYRERDWRGYDRIEVIAMVNVEKLKVKHQ